VNPRVGAQPVATKPGVFKRRSHTRLRREAGVFRVLQLGGRISCDFLSHLVLTPVDLEDLREFRRQVSSFSQELPQTTHQLRCVSAGPVVSFLGDLMPPTPDEGLPGATLQEPISR